MKQKAEGWQNLAADIPSNYSRLIARELDMTTRQLPVLLRGTGLDVEQFLSEDGLLTLAQQVRILRNALLLSGQPAFGLMLGKRLTPATHGAMGFAASSSPDRAGGGLEVQGGDTNLPAHPRQRYPVAFTAG